MNKVLIIGGGLSGCVMTRILLDENVEVDLVEKNSKLGGMCTDYYDKNAQIYVNKYGAHIWHFDEDSEKHWDWISQFGRWKGYEHKVMCLGNGNFTYWPINRTYSKVHKFLGGKKIDDEFIDSYSRKMWGDDYDDVMGSIKKRFEPKGSMSNKFFGDEKQYILCSGFSNLCNDLVKGANVKLETQIHYDIKLFEKYDYVILTGGLDDFYYGGEGKLKYKGIEFTKEVIMCDGNILPTPVLNLNTNKKYLRVVEYNQFYDNDSHYRVLVKEEPSNKTSFYPVLSVKQKEKYAEYVKVNEAHSNGKIKLLGRLAKYKYLDMDEVLVECFELKKELKDEKKL